MTASGERFRILDRTTAYQGFMRLEVVTLEQRRADGTIGTLRREIETHGDGAAVLAYDPSRRTAILVRQLRMPVAIRDADNAFLTEVIAGLRDHAGDDATETGRREAMEEAGLTLQRIEPVAALYSMPGLSTELTHLLLAEADFATARVAGGGGLAEEGEDIEILEIPLVDLARQADAGGIADLKTFALIQTLRIRRPDLFA